MEKEDLVKKMSLLDSVAYIKTGETIRQLRVIRGENRVNMLKPVIGELIIDIDSEKAVLIQKLLTDYEYDEAGECLSILQGDERKELEDALVVYILNGGEL